MMQSLLAFFKDTPTTASFILISCFVSLITGFGHFYTTLYWFVYDNNLIADGEIWRLITPIFLHFPAFGIIFAHLAFNMIWLYEFGKRVEYSDGTLFLGILIISSGIVSNIAQSLVSVGLFGGMSAVVYALVGYLTIRTKLSPQYPLPIPLNIAYVLIAFMFLSLIGVFGDNIANTAHFTGFIYGTILGLLWRNKTIKQ